MSKDQNHGKAFGQLVWRGRPKEKIKQIGAALKKEWRLLETPNYKHFTASAEDLAKLIPKVNYLAVENAQTTITSEPVQDI